MRRVANGNIQTGNTVKICRDPVVIVREPKAHSIGVDLKNRVIKQDMHTGALK